jgi:DNA-cytosine methyltransferase
MLETSKGINVLSLFDGMSCGQIALDKLGIKVDNYFASEIDKYAIQVTQKNYPNTKQIGSVVDVRGEDLPKIDLLFGGSPCQSFSRAGDGSGFDGKSKLFWEFVRVLKEVKPKYFLLENVVMKKEWEDIITDELRVSPIKINSSLVSAQNRNRLYWTNIPNIEQPKDKEVYLQDILFEFVEDKYFLTDKGTSYITNNDRLKKKFTALNGDKSLTLMSQYNQSKNGTFLCVDGNGRIDTKKTGTLTQRYYKGVENYGSNPFILSNHRFRKLTPVECERLQNVPENYTDSVSDTQRYKMLGNGWTVDVIAHIFKNLKTDADVK